MNQYSSSKDPPLDPYWARIMKGVIVHMLLASGGMITVSGELLEQPPQGITFGWRNEPDGGYTLYIEAEESHA